MMPAAYKSWIDKYYLVLILALSFALAIFYRLNLGYNTLHFDEAGYLFVGERLLNGATWPTKTYIFSSDIPLVLLAFFQQWWGDYGGRIFSSIVSMASLVCIYHSLSLLGCSRVSRLFGIALISLQISHIAIGRLATYDALCFFLVSLSFMLGVWSLVKNNNTLSVLAGLTVVLAALSKYIAIVYAPVFVVVLFLYDKRKALWFGVSAFPLLVGYVIVHFSDLITLFNGQVRGSHAGNVSDWVLLTYVFYLAWPLLVGSVLFFRKGIQRRSLSRLGFKGVSLFIGFSLPILAYHFYNNDFISLYKHSVYFLVGVSFLLVWLVDGQNALDVSQFERVRTAHVGRCYAILLGLTILNAGYWVNQSEQGWPNYQELYSALTVHSGDRILSEDPYNFRYRYSSKTALNNIKDVNWFDYDHDGVRNTDDVLSAVKDGYFDYIILDKTIRPNLCRTLTSGNHLALYDRIYFKPNQSIASLVNRNGPASVALYKKKSLVKTSYPISMEK